jgi:alginate O-acetyltransferase complex protein AlgI
MVFSSHLFIFYFLPLTLLLYFGSPKRGRHLVLTLLSYSFYGWANPLFMTLMLFSTVVDYICGGIIFNAGPSQARRRKKALAVSILTNLSLLGFFKYFNFATENYQALLHMLGMGSLDPGIHLQVILPLGISFYTFQSMSYSIDIYRGHAKAIRNFIDFACYVSMFPQLVAGPIIRFQEIADQLEARTHTVTKFARGAAFVCVGLSKKVLLANPCGKVADMTFDALAVNTLDAWYGVTAYAFQIYFDFSAYSDMAIGLGLMLGFVFPKNFDSPYHAASITDFWRRWHISLSTWLRDYVYIPLGGNRKGLRRTYINLALVMLIGGLWHGAAWNFVIWGALHGLLLSGERLRGKASLYHRLPRAFRVAITFVIVLFTWVFFRAENMEHALSYCRCMLAIGEVPLSSGLIAGVIYKPYYLLMMGLAAVIVWAAPQTWDWTRRLTPAKVFLSFVLFYTALLALITQEYNPFIYFIF